jgi:beta-lactamase superfamily II metal-dependent hydrolase
MMVIRIDMLPAAQGDALWIEYGDPHMPHRVLIDGGTAATYDWLRTRIRALPKRKCRFELLVVTHVDADHIEGAVRLLNDPSLDVEFGDIWFNAWEQLSDVLGPLQGEFLSSLIKVGNLPWNKRFDGAAVMVPEAGTLPTAELEGGMKLTLLSPRRDELIRLRDDWVEAVTEAGMAPGVTREALALLESAKKLRPKPSDLLGSDEAMDLQQLADEPSDRDRKEANSSSIVVLAEYEEEGQKKRCLLGADGVPDVLEATVPRLLLERGAERLSVDAFKLPHHGSQRNVTSKLVRMVPARWYLFSTNGAYFNHPDKQAVARVILDGGKSPELIFNYRTQENEIWDDTDLMAMYGYRADYPMSHTMGIGIEF